MISSAQVIAKAVKMIKPTKEGKHLNGPKIREVWNTIGLNLSRNLERGAARAGKLSGTVIPGLGMFTRDMIGENVFIADKQLCKSANARQLKQSPIGVATCYRLNMKEIAQTTKVSLLQVEIILRAVLKVYTALCKQALKKGESIPGKPTVRLSLNPGAEIMCQLEHRPSVNGTVQPQMYISCIFGGSDMATAEMNQGYMNKSQQQQDRDGVTGMLPMERGVQMWKQIKELILSRFGMKGLHSFARVLRELIHTTNDNGSTALTLEEMNYALKDYGIDLNRHELKLVLKALEWTPSNDSIDVADLLLNLRGTLSDLRRALVEEVFRQLDSSGDGTISLAELKERYDTANHPKVKSKEKTRSQVLRDFALQFAPRKDELITREDFINYYTNISAAIKNDDDFEDMIYSEWDLEGEEEMKTRTSFEVEESSKKHDSNVNLDSEFVDDLKGSAYERKLWNGLRQLLYTPPCDIAILLRRLGCPSHGDSVKLKPNIFNARLLSLLKKKSKAVAKHAALMTATASQMDETPDINIKLLLKEFVRRFGGKKIAFQNGKGNIVDRLRVKFYKSHGATWVNVLKDVVRRFDSTGDNFLDRDELKAGFENLGLTMPYTEIDQVMSFFDRNGDGVVSIAEVNTRLRGELSQVRALTIDTVYRVIREQPESGHHHDVSSKWMLQSSNLACHPDVVSGRLTVQELRSVFRDYFSDNLVSVEEFRDVASDLGAAIEGDDLFESTLCEIFLPNLMDEIHNSG